MDNNACIEDKDEGKQSIREKKERDKNYDTIVMLLSSNLMAAEINERSNSTNTSLVTRPAQETRLESV